MYAHHVVYLYVSLFVIHITYLNYIVQKHDTTFAHLFSVQISVFTTVLAMQCTLHYKNGLSALAVKYRILASSNMFYYPGLFSSKS